jgi:membrane protein implicated in regulation of membrane protease activity
MNGSLIFVLLLVSVVMCASVMREYLKQRQREPGLNEELEDTLSKIAQLEERIQVLERIITEKRFDLKGEIDSL